MALITVAGGLFIPPIRRHDPDLVAGATLDAAVEKFAFIFRVPKQGVLRGFHFRTTPASSVNVASVFKFSFQDVNVALDPCTPDGIVDQFQDFSASFVGPDAYVPAADLTTEGSGAGTKRSVNRNELLACVIEYQTFTGGDSLKIAYADARGTAAKLSRPFGHFPYAVFYDGASWSRVAVQGSFIFALEYDDDTYAFISPETPPRNLGPGDVFVIDAVNSGSDPDEIGAKFRFPFPVRVGGAWLMVDHNTAGKYEVRLYDSSPATIPLEQVAIDPAQTFKVSGKHQVLYVPFLSEHDLAKDTYYRLTILGTTLTDVPHSSYTVFEEETAEATSGGVDWHETRRTDSGAWTDALQTHPLMGLHITALEEDEAGGGGGGGGGFVAVDRGFGRGLIS